MLERCVQFSDPSRSVLQSLPRDVFPYFLEEPFDSLLLFRLVTCHTDHIRCAPPFPLFSLTFFFQSQLHSSCLVPDREMKTRGEVESILFAYLDQPGRLLVQFHIVCGFRHKVYLRWRQIEFQYEVSQDLLGVLSPLDDKLENCLAVNREEFEHLFSVSPFPRHARVGEFGATSVVCYETVEFSFRQDSRICLCLNEWT